MSKLRKFGRIFLNFKYVELAIAEVVYQGKNKAYKRQIDAVERAIIEETLQSVTDAVSSSILQSGLSAEQKMNTEKVCITSMPHVSDRDPMKHSTMYGMGRNGEVLWVAHAASDPSKQQPARNTDRADIISGP